MLHHLAGATIQVANLVNYKCHPQEDGKRIALNHLQSTTSSQMFKATHETFKTKNMSRRRGDNALCPSSVSSV